MVIRKLQASVELIKWFSLHFKAGKSVEGGARMAVNKRSFQPSSLQISSACVDRFMTTYFHYFVSGLKFFPLPMRLLFLMREDETIHLNGWLMRSLHSLTEIVPC
jgi:hypothetical protein